LTDSSEPTRLEQTRSIPISKAILLSKLLLSTIPIAPLLNPFLRSDHRERESKRRGRRRSLSHEFARFWSSIRAWLHLGHRWPASSAIPTSAENHDSRRRRQPRRYLARYQPMAVAASYLVLFPRFSIPVSDLMLCEFFIPKLHGLGMA
jgi:hypothetical protein